MKQYTNNFVSVYITLHC